MWTQVRHCDKGKVIIPLSFPISLFRINPKSKLVKNNSYLCILSNFIIGVAEPKANLAKNFSYPCNNSCHYHIHVITHFHVITHSCVITHVNLMPNAHVKVFDART